MTKDFSVDITSVGIGITQEHSTVLIQASSPRVAAEKAIHQHPEFGLNYSRKERQLRPGELLIIQVSRADN